MAIKEKEELVEENKVKSKKKQKKNQILENAEEKEPKEEETKKEETKKGAIKKEEAKKETEKKEILTQKLDNVQKAKTIEKNKKADEQKNIEEKPQKEKKKEKSTAKRIIKGFAIFIAILLLILVIVFTVFTVKNIRNDSAITEGVYVYGVDVSNLTKAEAVEKVTAVFDELLSQDITVISEDFESYISPSEISLEYDIESAVNAAFNIGKSGDIFSDNYDVFRALVNGRDITPTYSIDEDALSEILDDLSKDLPNAVIESSYYIEDNTLVLSKGSDGYVVDVEASLEVFIANIESFDYLNNSIELVLEEQSPTELDLDAIYEEIYTEPEDAYYTTNPYAVYPSSTGVDFAISLDEAKELLAEAESECEIELETTYPDVTTDDLTVDAFPDLLATYSTSYNTANTDRTTNLKLAANKINGTVVLAGDTFSYNETVGERTIAAGYKEASIFVNGEVTSGLGGGICQVSTTLFNAALYANLEMVELYNHQIIPGYSSAGRDATVVWGSKDFQFKNARSYAIKIVCSVSNGVVKFSIYGKEEETEYDVSISVDITSQTSTSIKSTTYRTLKLNGKTVSTEKIYSCTYLVSDDS